MPPNDRAGAQRQRSAAPDSYIKKKMITFSLVSGGTSVAALFMAGYLPGILWGLACMIVIYFFAKKHGYRSKTSFTAIPHNSRLAA